MFKRKASSSAATDLFASAGPHVFTAPASSPFLPAVARGVLALTEGAPGALADAVVLLPTRRAVRAMSGAFMAETGAGAAVLPQIRALGDVEADEPPFAYGALGLDAPPAISPQQRRFELAALLHAKAARRDPGADPAASLPLADALARVLDDAAEMGAQLSAVSQLYEALPAHLQDAALFLDIVAQAWPARLAELGRIDPGARRAHMLHAAAEHWREHPPEGLVIAAGSTGSLPATAAVLSAVASAPRGCVLLPGLDVEADADGWDKVDEQHPQAGMKRLLASMGVARDLGRARRRPRRRRRPAAA